MARVKITGLESLMQRIEKAKKLNRRKKLINQVIADEVHSLVLQGFAQSKAPSGKKWKSLKTRDGQPLLDTGRLRNSITAKATTKEATVGTNVVYADVHDKGSRKKGIPKRQFLPGKIMPKSWMNSVEEAASEAVEALLGGDL